MRKANLVVCKAVLVMIKMLFQEKRTLWICEPRVAKLVISINNHLEIPVCAKQKIVFLLACTIQARKSVGS